MNDGHQLRLLHYKYWIGILVAAIILFFAAFFFNVPSLVEKFTFALTISSFVLAILAIVSTISSNTLVSSNLSQFVILNRELKDSANALDKSAQNLGREVSEIPARLDAIDQKVTASNQLMQDQLKQTPKPDGSTPFLNITWDPNGVFYIFSEMTFGTMTLVYFLVRTAMEAARVRKESYDISLGRVLSWTELLLAANMCRMVKLIKYVIHDDTLIVNDCNSSLASHFNGIIRLAIQSDPDAPGTRALTYGIGLADGFFLKDEKERKSQETSKAASQE